MTTASKPATAPARPAHGLASPDKFFASICPLFGTMTQAQFEGIQAKLAVFAAQGSPLAYVAYGLATSFHETAQRMQPIQEIGRGRNYPYGKPGKHGGQIAYGRGDVQLTWDYNYERADDEARAEGRADVELQSRARDRDLGEDHGAGHDRRLVHREAVCKLPARQGDRDAGRVHLRAPDHKRH
ncbi:hypothetical protein QP162_05990 [Sphingomonas aurantiaca]|uniref:hypothetical protein n=1 Tax=Sphingomonas aurantiaca TaxID=185949 RepID=UPI002FDF7A82